MHPDSSGNIPLHTDPDANGSRALPPKRLSRLLQTLMVQFESAHRGNHSASSFGAILGIKLLIVVALWALLHGIVSAGIGIRQGL